MNKPVDCSICGCPLCTNNEYGKDTPNGHGHISRHHLTPQRFFTHKKNGETREGILNGNDKKDFDPKTINYFCYDCHEELLHNPIFLPEQIKQFAEIVRKRGLQFNQQNNQGDIRRLLLAGRVKLLNEVIGLGLDVLSEKDKG